MGSTGSCSQFSLYILMEKKAQKCGRRPIGR